MIPLGQVRGILAERVVISTELDPYMGLRALASYGGLSLRKLREHLADPVSPLPCYRVGRKVLVRRSDFDAWIAQYRRVGGEAVARIVEGVLRDLRSG
jgi:excisionase family DNA binding protein